MGNEVGAQLSLLGQAALLGALCAVVYDLLRTIRLRRTGRWLMHGLDALYAAAVLLAIFLFALRRGQGELRLYMLLGIALGAVVYFAALSGLLRPVWAFWVDAAAAFAALLWKPAAFVAQCVKKIGIFLKKLFYFWGKYATIIMYQWKYFLFTGTQHRKGGGAHREKKTERKEARRNRSAGGGAADRRGRLRGH